MNPRVALINMPFANAERPSLALGLLKPLAHAAGWTADVHNFNLRFARRIGSKAYNFLCGGSVTTREQPKRVTASTDHLMGEWLFSQFYYGSSAAKTAAYGDFLCQQSDFSASLREAILDIRLEVPSFIAECAGSIDWASYAAVGFTSTFEQTMASLCLAREIKLRAPQTRILLGGANCEGTMGHALARNFPFLDLVCTGEADLVFPRLLRELQTNGEWWRVPGFVARAPEGLRSNAPAPLTVDLDALPIPDFDEYFAERDDGEQTNSTRAVILETSRGCWWGQRSHCTFCGLNGSTMRFRVKSPQRALDEFRHVLSRYEVEHVDYSDNILHRDYLDSYVVDLARENSARTRPVSIFYETKSNLKREEMRLLSQAQVRHIQPGIESFDDSVLRIMGKGVRGLHNVAVLKWGKVYGITVLWNLIYGFPGEPPEAYARMADLCGRLTHLQPPRTVAPIRLDRFSPNFTQAPAKGLIEVRPKPAYKHVFSLADSELNEIAYFFDFSYQDGRDPFDYTVSLDEAFSSWEAAWQAGDPMLRADALPDGGLRLIDTRFDPGGKTHHLTRREASLYLYFDTPHARHTALDLARELRCTAAELDSYLAKWEAARLVACAGDIVLSLAAVDDETLSDFDSCPRSQLEVFQSAQTHAAIKGDQHDIGTRMEC